MFVKTKVTNYKLSYTSNRHQVTQQVVCLMETYRVLQLLDGEAANSGLQLVSNLRQGLCRG
jgi:hypothetical protein